MNIITCCRCYRSGSSWLRVTPFAIRKQLKWIKDRYNNIPMYITENGVADRNGSLLDTHRISYYRAYINEVLKGTFNLQFITLKKKCIILINKVKNMMLDFCIYLLLNFAYVCIKLHYQNI